ncbi:hypothetical protein CSIM01_03289 [Colletotrichum simmondsii]|uniref:Uncharacterized protein n=1 Tax=Colletotrichum simmondsii TaxID=703756 RepID=A0A135SBT1_9PEZI|nr:hypothetical protein CSIM01_03289 [Colletotrichum simmondsii]
MFKTLRWSVWGQQIWAFLGAAAALITMVVLLGRFNNRPIFNEKGVTLNAIISILSVTVKAAVAFILSECIAQWKWILYAREERLLIDFDRLDGAARGPMGSLRVLLKTKGAFIVRFGAVLTLIAVALDPFAQQLLQLREDVVYEKSNNDTMALISRSKLYSLGTANVEERSVAYFHIGRNTTIQTGESISWNITTSIPPSMEGAIMSGFYKSPEELRRETLFQCSSGNCTFDPFVTIGVCHRCEDLTSNLTRLPVSYDDIMNTIKEYRTANTDEVKVGGSNFYASGFNLPNGHIIANTNGCRPYQRQNTCRSDAYAATSFGTGNPYKTVAMKDIDTLLWSMSLIYADINALNASGFLNQENRSAEITWPTVPLKALECALYYCAKAINSTVTNSRLEEDITEVAGTKRSAKSWGLPELMYWNRNQGPLWRYDKVTPEYRAPPEEMRSLEFHKLWSVVTRNPLEIELNSTDKVTIQSDSIKSLSAYVQTLFRWEPWFSDTKVIAQLSELTGTKNAVGFNGASFGPVTSLYAAAQPPALNRLVSTSRSNFAGISAVFESMAMSMTNEIRRTSKEADVARNGMDTMTQKGVTRRCHGISMRIDGYDDHRIQKQGRRAALEEQFPGGSSTRA